MRWTTLAVAVLAVAVGVLVGAQAHASGYLFPADPDNPLVIRGCVIRFDERASNGDTRPTIHANGSHFCVGVDRVYSDYSTGDLRIVHDSDPHRAIVSIAVSPDETLVARGIDCGASGGVRWTKVRCYDEDGLVKPWSGKMRGEFANLWVTWVSWAG